MRKNALVLSNAPASGLRPSAGKALFLLLAALPFTACKCHGNLNNTNGALVASPDPIAFGPRGYGTKSVIHVVITNQGDAPVNINQAPFFNNDTNKAFSAVFPDAGTPISIDLEVAGTTGMDVYYDPPKNETDYLDAGITLQVDNDSNIPLVVQVEGNGVDPCFNVVCDAGVAPVPGSSNPGGCFGTCQAGKCVYAGPCSDKSQCLSNGTCNPSTGVCQGTFDCAQPGAGTCNGLILTGDVAPGSCDQGLGTCLYNHQTVTCDCSCVQSGSNASCSYSWEPVQGLPPGSVSSVWSAGQTEGDLWLSVIPAGASAGINPNTVYQEVNGTWNPVATVANVNSFICSGPGCGLALAGSSDMDVYGVTDCTTVAGGTCTVGGAWHYTGSSADENFPTLGSIGPDYPLTTLLDIGGTGFALNSDPTGPEIVMGTGGTWSIIYNTGWHCDTAGSIWGTSASDLWLGWGCNAKGGSVLPGQLAHYNGTGLDSPAFTLPTTTDYAAGMWGTSDADIWAVGTHRWHYNGTAWAQDPVDPPVTGNDQTVWGNSTDYFAGGGYIALYHWTSAADWTEECIAPGYEDPSVYSFTSDGTNFYATTSSTTTPGLVQRCPNGTCP